MQDTVWIDEEERICREDAQALHLPPTCPTSFGISPLVLGVQYDVRLLTRNANQIGYRDVGTGVRAVPIFRPSRPALNVRVISLSTTQARSKSVYARLHKNSFMQVCQRHACQHLLLQQADHGGEGLKCMCSVLM
jgi:hypothetical protein